MSNNYLHGIEVVEVDDGIRAIETVRSSVIGVVGTAPNASEDEFPLNKPVLVTRTAKIKSLGDSGTLVEALQGISAQGAATVVAVRVAKGVSGTETINNIKGNLAAKTGLHAFLDAESAVHVAPRILIAPGFTGVKQGTSKNVVLAALIPVAEKLRAIIVAEGPNSTNTEALAWQKTIGSSRVYAVDPYVVVGTPTLAQAAKPASPYVAGVIAALDGSRGFWHSPSNKPIHGIAGTSRGINYALSDKSSDANLLNENNLATIIYKNGYRLWGNRTCGTDPQWTFLSVRRTADMVYEAVENSMLWALDRPFSPNLIEDVQESINAYLRHLKAQGAILGGKSWLDKDLNNATSMAAGKLYIDFDIEPPAPLERLSFRAHRENGYYEELASSFASQSAA